MLGRLANAQPGLPQDNLGLPVLVTLSNGNTGSGFFIEDARFLYLVTAKHVLFDPVSHALLAPSLRLLSYSKDLTDSTPNSETLDLFALQRSGNIKPHPSEDVVVVKAFSLRMVEGKRRTFPEPGVTFVRQSTEGLVTASVESVTSFKDVQIGDDVIVFGYPTSLGLQQMPQLDTSRPLLRKGIVAGTNPQTKSLILDSPSYFGNSGGLVMELVRAYQVTLLRIIGVVVSFVPFVQAGASQTFAFQMASNSGYSIAVPMDFVLELIR